MVHVNKFYLGQRVQWPEGERRAAGIGTVDSIYLSGLDRLCYRVERDRPAGTQLYELMEEAELTAVE